MPNGTVKQIGLSKSLLILAIVLVVGQVCYWGVQAYSAIWGTTGNYSREISVTAQGKAISAPDVAVVRVGVKTEGMKVATVVQENNEKMNAVLAALKDLKIASKDIQTINYSLNPQYDYTDKGERVFKGYALNQEVKVKIRDFAKAGDVLEKATGLGANLVGDLQFTIDDPATAKAAALQDAIGKAKAKGREISLASGLKLKKIVNIYEDYNQYPQYSSSVGLGGGEAFLMKATAAAAPDIQAGEQEITVNVTLVYRVK